METGGALFSLAAFLYHDKIGMINFKLVIDDSIKENQNIFLLSNPQIQRKIFVCNKNNDFNLIFFVQWLAAPYLKLSTE